MLGTRLQKLRGHLQHAFLQSVDYSRPNIVAIGWVGFVGFPLYYVIWTYAFPQAYENLPVRLFGSLLAVPLILRRSWPARLERFYPAYWFVTLCYALPFFFVFMLLSNNASIVWGMSTMAAAVLMVLLFSNWIMLVIMVVVGAGLAYGCFVVVNGGPPEDVTAYLVETPVYLFVLIGGSIINYNMELLKRDKIQVIASTTNNIAHELRTPLLSIRSGALGMERYLPQLLQGYELARANGLPVEPIRSAHYRQLGSVLQRIEAETRYSNLVIDLLLSNAQQDHIDNRHFTRVAMADCIDDAIKRYPFKSEHERERTSWQPANDFLFMGSAVLMTHVLFNLIKNALRSTARAGRGTVNIWMSPADNGYTLHFRDTGEGIEPDQLPFIFNRFYSSASTEYGTGIGLAFCRMVMKSFGGKISCLSEPDGFTEFLLHFPGGEPHDRS